MLGLKLNHVGKGATDICGVYYSKGADSRLTGWIDRWIFDIQIQYTLKKDNISLYFTSSYWMAMFQHRLRPKRNVRGPIRLEDVDQYDGLTTISFL